MKAQVNTLQELLNQEVCSAIGLERFLAKSLPRFQHHAQNQVLKDSFAEEASHCLELSERLGECVRVAEDAQEDHTLKALLEDTNRRLASFSDTHLVDSELIATLRRVLGLQMAGYTNIETRAKLLGLASLAQMAAAAVERKECTDRRLEELAIHQVNWRAKWWNEDPATPWERLKVALRKDWAASFKRGSHSLSDTMGEFKKPLSETADRLVEEQEPAFKYGYGAAIHYNEPEWNEDLERKLMMNYGGHWLSAKGQIRSGWDYQREVAALDGFTKEVSA